MCDTRPAHAPVPPMTDLLIIVSLQYRAAPLSSPSPSPPPVLPRGINSAAHAHANCRVKNCAISGNHANQPMPRDYATLAWRRYFPPTTCSPEAMMIAETGDVCAEGGGGEREIADSRRHDPECDSSRRYLEKLTTTGTRTNASIPPSLRPSPRLSSPPA